MIKIGVIGIGKWGKNHARDLSEMNCELVGVADISPKTKAIAKKYGIKHKEDYRKLLPLVDAVSVVTPTYTHYEIVKECLSANKHVLVEKPMTLDSKKAEELVHIASKKNLIFSVGFLFRFNPAVLKLKKILNDIGEIHYMTARWIHSNRPPRNDSGAIFDFAPHLFDTLNFILGRYPKKIFCKKVNYLSKEREDCAIILLDYGDFISSLEVGWLHPLKKRDIWIIGSEEKVYVDLLEQKMKKYPIKIYPHKTINSGCEEVEIEWEEPLKKELEHFIDCIENDKKPINDGMRGYFASKLCEQALESAEKGKEILL